MSDERDPLGERAGFLERWSKRKALARSQPEDEPTDPAQPAAEGAQDADNDAKAEKEAFDLSKLPSLDDITAQTNLADFMRKEVPAALRNAALKKAWALDPVIRDYVNPAMEYAYDWNAPGGVPGNGAIDAGVEALRDMVAKAQSDLTGHTLDLRTSTDGPESDAAVVAQTPTEEPAAVRLAQLEPTEKTDGSDTSPDDGGAPAPRDPDDLGRSRRRHGGALPT